MGLRIEAFAEEARSLHPYEYLFRKRQDGACVFLKGNSCAIYELRPLVCRFYPFSLRMVPGKGYVFSPAKECPGLGRGRPLPKAFFKGLLERALEQLRESKEGPGRKPKVLMPERRKPYGVGVTS